MTALDPRRAQPSVLQIYSPKELVFGASNFSIGELSARCARIPELAPILESLEEVGISHLSNARGVTHSYNAIINTGFILASYFGGACIVEPEVRVWFRL